MEWFLDEGDLYAHVLTPMCVHQLADGPCNNNRVVQWHVVTQCSLHYGLFISRVYP
jgi:hypothetical protein